MTDAPPAAGSLRRTLIAGGALLIVSAVATFSQPSFFAAPLSVVLGWLGVTAFSAALLVFAFGLGRAGSIVARGPLGVTAAAVAAAWPFVERAVTLALPFESIGAAFYQPWAFLSWGVMLGALAVFTVRIARAGVVRGRARWMPLWGLVLVTAPQLLAQIVMTAFALGAGDQDVVFLVLGLGQLLAFAVPLGLGIIALLVANRPVSTQAPVQVYPPAP